MKIELSEEDQKKIIELHQAYQSSIYAEYHDNDIDMEIRPGFNWFKGWSEKGGLDAQEFPPATIEDLLHLEKTLKTALPALYRAYLLGPRCIGMEFEDFKIFPNIPGEGLTTIYKQMTRDPYLEMPLIKNKYIPIGKKAGGSYDPLCFNAKFELFTFDHEEILMFGKLNPKKVFDNINDLFETFISQCNRNIKG